MVFLEDWKQMASSGQAFNSLNYGCVEGKVDQFEMSLIGAHCFCPSGCLVPCHNGIFMSKKEWGEGAADTDSQGMSAVETACSTERDCSTRGFYSQPCSAAYGGKGIKPMQRSRCCLQCVWGGTIIMGFLLFYRYSCIENWGRKGMLSYRKRKSINSATRSSQPKGKNKLICNTSTAYS